MGAPRPAQARNDWACDWDAIPDSLGGEAPPLVMEVNGWLTRATSKTSRGLRNQPFDALPLWGDGGNQEVPPGAGWPEKTMRGSSGP